MQPNISNHERLSTVLMGSMVMIQGPWTRKVLGLALLWRGISGYCPLYHALGRKALHLPRALHRSIVIDREIESVRDILEEGDPLFHDSSRKIFPITAGDLLWDFQFEKTGDGRLTEVRASLSEENRIFGLRSYLSRGRLQDLADRELQRIKRLIETDHHGIRRPG